MGKWWMSAALTVGLLGASAASAQIAPPPALQCPPSTPPDPTYAVPPAPPDAPAQTPGSERGFDNAFDAPPEGLPPPRFHADFDYLAWWTKRTSAPVLVTRGSFFDTVPGALGEPNTTALVSGAIGESFHSGGRLTLGYELFDDRAWRVQGSAFILQNRNDVAAVSSGGLPGSPVIARPFFNGMTNQEDADPVAVPNVMSGTIVIQLQQNIYGGEVNAAYNCWSHDASSMSLAFLAGGRYLSMNESLIIREHLVDLPGLGQPGNVYSLTENFTARNHFYGCQVGAEYAYAFGPFSWQVVGKLGAGPTQEILEISGATRIDQPDGTVVQSTNRALLVQPSNAGTHKKTVFTVIPEISFNGFYALNDHIRVGAGYDFIWWSQVLRPANEIDRGINIQALQPFDQVGPARPAVLMHETNFWMQGLNVTLELSF